MRLAPVHTCGGGLGCVACFAELHANAARLTAALESATKRAEALESELTHLRGQAGDDSCADLAARLLAAVERAEVATDELRDLCNAVIRIGWDRTAADVHEQAVKIIAKLDNAASATEGENKNG